MAKILKYGIGSSNNFTLKRELQSVKVIDIILDPTHPKYHTSEDVGTIFYAHIENKKGSINPEVLPKAVPLFSFQKYYPLKNEIVLILTGDIEDSDGNSLRHQYYLPSINLGNNPHHNAAPTGNRIENSGNYNNTLDGHTKNSENESLDLDFGYYFQEKDYIRSLRPFEGDNILEGRFGNSIRLGSTTKKQNPWSQRGENSDPIIVIRNGQFNNPENTTFNHNVENINLDASSIYLTSNQSIDNFQRASNNMQSYGENMDVPYMSPEDQISQIPPEFLELLNP